MRNWSPARNTAMPTDRRSHGPLLILAGALCFSTTGFVQALAPEGATPYVIGALRMAVGGIALLSSYGLHEISGSESGELFITLFRAFRRTVMSEGEPAGELQKTLTASTTDISVFCTSLHTVQDGQGLNHHESLHPPLVSNC